MRPGIDYGRLFNDPGWEPARVHAEAYALQAFAYAERGVSLNDRAREAVRRGRGALESVRVNRHVAEAALDGAAGLIDLKDDKTPLDTAIKHFRSSLARVPASETYVLLARAYLLKIDEERAHAARWIRRGEDACRCAIELDVTERYSAQAKALRVEFAAAKEVVALRHSTSRNGDALIWRAVFNATPANGMDLTAIEERLGLRRLAFVAVTTAEPPTSTRSTFSADPSARA